MKELEKFPAQLYAKRLSGLLESTSENRLKYAILVSFMNKGDPSVIPVCIRLLRSKDDELMQNASLALCSIINFQKYDYGEREPFVFAPLKEQSPEEREEAIKMWEKWWEENKAFQPEEREKPIEIEEIVARLNARAEVNAGTVILRDKSLSPGHRAYAAEELRKLGIEEGQRSILPEVMEVVESGDDEKAKKKFFSMHGDYAKKALMDIIFDQSENMRLRITCMILFKDVATKDDAKDLFDLIKQERDKRMTFYIFNIVQYIVGPESIPQLLSFAKEGDVSTRGEALRALTLIGAIHKLPGCPIQVDITEDPAELDKLYDEWQVWWQAYTKEGGE